MDVKDGGPPGTGPRAEDHGGVSRIAQTEIYMTNGD